MDLDLPRAEIVKRLSNVKWLPPDNHDRLSLLLAAQEHIFIQGKPCFMASVTEIAHKLGTMVTRQQWFDDDTGTEFEGTGKVHVALDTLFTRKAIGNSDNSPVASEATLSVIDSFETLYDCHATLHLGTEEEIPMVIVPVEALLETGVITLEQAGHYAPKDWGNSGLGLSADASTQEVSL